MTQRVIDTDIILKTYGRDRQKSIDTYLLLVRDQTSPIYYKVRMGGESHPISGTVKGYIIPIMLRDEGKEDHFYRYKELDPHHVGCSKLNYKTNPELVEEFANRFDKYFYRQYVDPQLSLKVDREYIANLMEGCIPVIANGESIMGLKFKNERCILITGNCV